jgi:Flp pilus assembly protein TadG
MERTMKQRIRLDEGVTMPFVAISLIALLAIAGLVVDGGNALAARRQVQNAADSAALAGTNALQEYREDTTKPVNSIYLAAQGAASDNNADSTGFTCLLVLYNASTGAETGTQACPQSSGSIPSNAYGVRVTTQRTEGTFFMRALGSDNYTARTDAAANLQKASIGNGPFFVCGTYGDIDGPWGDPDETDEERPRILLADNITVNPNAIGYRYDIYGNDIKTPESRSCGNTSSSIRGLVDTGAGPFDLPGWWETKTGNKTGPTNVTLAGGCNSGDTNTKDIPVPCDVVLPLCTHGTGHSSSFTPYCVAAGRFRIVVAENHNVDAVFLGKGTVLSGFGNGIPTAADPVVIHLSE